MISDTSSNTKEISTHYIIVLYYDKKLSMPQSPTISALFLKTTERMNIGFGGPFK